MKLADFAPKKHLFVCTHSRPAGDPLGGGCADRGERVFAALKNRVAETFAFHVWVTRTGCMGICPKEGATVASTEQESLLQEVSETDAAQIV
jgi:predicted metal-binding protein